MARPKNTKSDTAPTVEPKPTRTPKTEEITEVLKVTTGSVDVCAVSLTPYLHNRMSEKAKQTILFPSGRRTEADKATRLKHQPVEEFRASPYTLIDPTAATLCAIRSAAFKGAMRTAAVDLPGAKKAQVGRLVWVKSDLIEMFGVPQLKMDVVRSADMNRTPDIRTRAIFHEWACRFTIEFVRPLIRVQAVANLLAGGGLICGVGDGRPEKGALNYGQFRICDKDDPDFLRIVKTGGRAAQIEGFAHPTPYDAETAHLLTWFDDELSKRVREGRVSQQTAALESEVTR